MLFFAVLLFVLFATLFVRIKPYLNNPLLRQSIDFNSETTEKAIFISKCETVISYQVYMSVIREYDE